MKDYYTILGVLPDAEDIVIRAAYRALAQRYHPDRWTGDPGVAHERMASINEAFHVLGDLERRKSYDQERQNGEGPELRDEAEQESAFSSALKDMQERWGIACGIYPELKEERARLSQISNALAFAFVSFLVETRSFSNHKEIAEDLESRFLESYFGRAPETLAFAKTLIFSGRRTEARYLNRLVNVMGAGTPPRRLIDEVKKRFGAGVHKHDDPDKRRRLAQAFRRTRFYSDAKRLAESFGYEVQEFGNGLFGRFAVDVKGTPEGTVSFDHGNKFMEWVLRELAAD